MRRLRGRGAITQFTELQSLQPVGQSPASWRESRGPGVLPDRRGHRCRRGAGRRTARGSCRVATSSGPRFNSSQRIAETGACRRPAGAPRSPARRRCRSSSAAWSVRAMSPRPRGGQEDSNRLAPAGGVPLPSPRPRPPARAPTRGSRGAGTGGVDDLQDRHLHRPRPLSSSQRVPTLPAADCADLPGPHEERPGAVLAPVARSAQKTASSGPEDPFK